MRPKSFISLFFTIGLLSAIMVPLFVSGCTRIGAGHGDAGMSDSKKRQIELVIRKHMNVPATWTVKIGDRSRSNISGYDDLKVLFSTKDEPGKADPVSFLISSDNNRLARLSTFDLHANPADLIRTQDLPWRGSYNAPVSIVVFDDLQCQFCSSMNVELSQKTLSRYPNLVRIYKKDFPLNRIHPWAMHASIDANCLGVADPDAYWHYIDDVHERYQALSKSSDPDALLDKLARQDSNGLHDEAVDLCIRAQNDSLITASMVEGNALDIESTPVLFINGEEFVGNQGQEALWATIDRALKAKGIDPPAN